MFILLKINAIVTLQEIQIISVYFKATTRMIIGEIMDVSGHKAKNLSKDHHKNIIGFKAGHFVAPQPTLGMALVRKNFL